MFIKYIYDGTFEGLLTCIYEAYYSKYKPEKIEASKRHVPDLIHQEITIETSFEHAEVVLSAIESKISKAVLEKIYIAYLSESSDCEINILNYIRLGFKLGSNLELHMHNKFVIDVNTIYSRVLKEAHLLLGFIRFKSINDQILYSSIEPDNNILTIIAPHFAERFSSEKWIINDVKRKLAVLYDGTSKWVLAPFSTDTSKKFIDSPDSEYEHLWRNYFKTIAIKERENPKLQKRLMPKRYWKHIFETNND
ncbi:TIGR03915 family putative DNA repair protein [Clostridium oryzae]|uniref:DUF4130 domain-containing protein n=1 Tax=Clostridium oryzae TaxID=1450648 RepID=A0A1V4IU02_9CLOT|nr:TIGR03915 family putative DNA repair protein [Clostridium oryzae]OPJ63373.1 hypothetical protein CLORY_11550 [Clostridium oryzae]